MKKKIFWGVQLFLSFLVIATTDIYAQADLIIGRDVEIVKQHQWLIFIHGLHTISIYDSTGEKLDSVDLGQRYIDNVSADILGNCIINCSGDAEFSRIAIYYDNNGKEKWRYYYQYMGGGEGFLLSPDGKYTMQQKHLAKQFTMFATADTAKKIPNPYLNLDPGIVCKSQFSNDGTINTITKNGILYQFDPATSKIKFKYELKTPEGKTLIPNLDSYPYPAVNSNSSLFAMLLNDTISAEPKKTSWLLVYNNKDGVSRLERIVEGPLDINVVDSQVVITRKDTEKSRYLSVLYKSIKSPGEVIDSNTQFNTIPARKVFKIENGLMFYNQISHYKYDLNNRQIIKDHNAIPFFKPKGQKKLPSLFISDK
jgi:hypothetical protein